MTTPSDELISKSFVLDINEGHKTPPVVELSDALAALEREPVVEGEVAALLDADIVDLLERTPKYRGSDLPTAIGELRDALRREHAARLAAEEQVKLIISQRDQLHADSDKAERVFTAFVADLEAQLAQRDKRIAELEQDQANIEHPMFRVLRQQRDDGWTENEQLRDAYKGARFVAGTAKVLMQSAQSDREMAKREVATLTERLALAREALRNIYGICHRIGLDMVCKETDIMNIRQIVNSVDPFDAALDAVTPAGEKENE